MPVMPPEMLIAKITATNQSYVPLAVFAPAVLPIMYFVWLVLPVSRANHNVRLARQDKQQPVLVWLPVLLVQTTRQMDVLLDGLNPNGNQAII